MLNITTGTLATLAQQNRNQRLYKLSLRFWLFTMCFKQDNRGEKSIYLSNYLSISNVLCATCTICCLWRQKIAQKRLCSFLAHGFETLLASFVSMPLLKSLIICSCFRRQRANVWTVNTTACLSVWSNLSTVSIDSSSHFPTFWKEH